MKVRVGCDIVEIKRFNNIDSRTLNKIFHKNELKNLKSESLAGLFAAKESCKKVFNDLNWHDIEVKKKRKGLAALLFSPVGIALITASTAGFVVAVANPSSNGVAKRESSPFK